jgi:hypothetical protein
MGTGLNNLEHTHTISAMKRDTLLIHATTWVDLKGFMMSEKANLTWLNLDDLMYMEVLKGEIWRCTLGW